MVSKNLLIVGCLIGIVIVIIGAFVIIPMIGISADISNSTDNNSTTNISSEDSAFDNSTPEALAISIARLNFGVLFNEFIVDDVYLTDDGKYWKVNLHYPNGKEPYVNVTIDAKTWMSKNSDYNEWNSLDELKASYIADIQTNGPESIDSNGKPQKITMNGKEIWKVSTPYMDGDGRHVAYVYVDLATGKSKSTLPSFNRAAGTDGWLTLKEVDDVINRGSKGDYPSNYLTDIGKTPFRDALRDSYPE